MSKKIIIGISAILASAIISFGVLFLIQLNRPTNDEDKSESIGSLVIDTSKSYQACSLVTTEQITSRLGSIAATLQPVKDLGIIGEQIVGEGAGNVSGDSQTCVYAFEPNGTEENGFNADNALTVVKTVYVNPEGTAPLVEQLTNDPTTTQVELGDTNSFFVSSQTVDGPESITSHRLLIFTSKERITLEIRQPSDAVSLGKDEAQSSLLSLAGEIQF